MTVRAVKRNTILCIWCGFIPGTAHVEVIYITKKCTMRLFGSIHLLAVPRTINKIKEMEFQLEIECASRYIYIIIINIPAIRASELTCGSKF